MALTLPFHLPRVWIPPAPARSVWGREKGTILRQILALRSPVFPGTVCVSIPLDAFEKKRDQNGFVGNPAPLRFVNGGKELVVPLVSAVVEGPAIPVHTLNPPLHISCCG